MNLITLPYPHNWNYQLNFQKGPFRDLRVRKAANYAINRAESGQIAYGESGKAPKFMAGYSDSLVPTWISAEDQKKLKEYEYSTTKADALMRDAGYAKGADWKSLAYWIHDHLPYSRLQFFPKLAAFNITWHERPVRSVYSFIRPAGYLLRGNEPALACPERYPDFPPLIARAR